jgi:hypothetical protein
VNAYHFGPELEIAKDILIPVVAILVSTFIAIYLARSERRAADRARIEDRRLDAQARAEDRRLAVAAREDDYRRIHENEREQVRQRGGAVALEAMEELLKVALEPDAQLRRDGLTLARSMLTKMTALLQPHHPDVYVWAIRELKQVTGAAGTRDDGPFSPQIDFVEERHIEFSINMLSWLMGEKDDEWFAERLEAESTGSVSDATTT